MPHWDQVQARDKVHEAIQQVEFGQAVTQKQHDMTGKPEKVIDQTDSELTVNCGKEDNQAYKM
jgi:hypothetical protein